MATETKQIETGEEKTGVVADFFEIARHRGITMSSISAKNSVTNDTLSHWRCGKGSPTLSKFETILERVGLRLTIVPIEPANPA